MTDYAVARKNMVDTQVATADVTDRRILAAMLHVPRELYVPVTMRETAYKDTDLAVAAKTAGSKGRYLMAPMVFAKLVQLAEIQSSDLILDVGCATGYSTAVLSQIADSVVGLETQQDLADLAGKTLLDQSVDNAAIVTGPLQDGYPSEGPYDVIFLNGSVPDVPRGLLEQLKDGGRLVCVLASESVGRATVYQNISGEFTERPGFSAAAKPLPGFESAPEFVF